MEPVDEASFREWLSEAGIKQHPGWEFADHLCFPESEEHERFWFPSFVPSDLPGFIDTALTAISTDGPHDLLRCHGGEWFANPEDTTWDDLMINDILHCYRVPEGASGALRFQESDGRALSAIVLAFYVHGWCVDNDLYIVAQERDAILETSHHGQLYGRFATAERMEQFRNAMLARGYDLPIKPPDTQFKCPSWLTGPVHHGPA